MTDGKTPQTPAGGAHPGSGETKGAPVAGPTLRTFTITLPAGLPLLSLNDRFHWRERHRRNQSLKKAAWAMALQGKVTHLHRISVTAEYQPPDRRLRDPDNIAPSVKAAIDGLVAAQVVPFDDSAYVVAVECRIGEPYPLGRLVLHVAEVEAGSS